MAKKPTDLPVGVVSLDNSQELGLNDIIQEKHKSAFVVNTGNIISYTEYLRKGINRIKGNDNNNLNKKKEMSSIETHRGVIRKIDTKGEDAKVYLFKKTVEGYESKTFVEFQEWSEDDFWNVIYEKEWLYVNGELYEWLEHKVTYDEEEYFCVLTKNDDGTINVFSQFYNSATNISEMIEDELKEIN